MPDTIRGSAAAGSMSQYASASRVEAMKPTDSSSGVDCAFPTTNSPARSTMKVSVIVPPASIASTRGSPPLEKSAGTSLLAEADLLRLLAQTARCRRRRPRRRVGPHDVRRDDHVVQRPVGLVPDRPQVVQQPRDAEEERAQHAEQQDADDELAQQRPAVGHRLTAVADDPDPGDLLAERLAVALPAAHHEHRVVDEV